MSLQGSIKKMEQQLKNKEQMGEVTEATGPRFLEENILTTLVSGFECN